MNLFLMNISTKNKRNAKNEMSYDERGMECCRKVLFIQQVKNIETSNKNKKLIDSKKEKMLALKIML